MTQQGWKAPDEWLEDPVMRKAVVYAIAQQQGLKVDWTTGAVYHPEPDNA